MTAPAPSAPPRRAVIVGAGVSAWVTAAALARHAAPAGWTVTIVAHGNEPDTLFEAASPGAADTGQPGVAQALHALGVDEPAILRATHASYSLGAAAAGWRHPGARFFRAYAPPLPALRGVAVHQLLARRGDLAATLPTLRIGRLAASQGRFAHPADDPRAPASHFDYGVHLDAAAYRDLLRARCESAHVRILDGPVADVRRSRPDRIDSLLLAGGGEVAGDLFVDASGPGAVLIGEALGVAYDDAPLGAACDRVATVTTQPAGPPAPHADLTARGAGWRRRLPSAARTRHDLFFASRRQSDVDAIAELMEGLDAPPLAEPQIHALAPGRRARAWRGNVVAVGLAAGYVEPVAATPLDLAHRAALRLLELLPADQRMRAEAAEYDRRTQEDLDHVADLAAAHVICSARPGAFWEDARAVAPSDTLALRLRQFESRGRIVRLDGEPFEASLWLDTFVGLGLTPRRHDRLADAEDETEAARMIDDMARAFAEVAAAMPRHDAYLARCLSA